MNIMVTREGVDLLVKIEFYNGWAGNAIWTFKNTCSDKFYAGLAGAELNRQLLNNIRNIREDAYESGYRDGRSRKKKCKFFSSRMESTP